MKELLLAGMAAAIALAAGAAHGADLPRKPVYKAPPPVAAPAPLFTWTGCYIGGHIGGGWGRKDWSVDSSDLLSSVASPAPSTFGLAALEGGPIDLGSQKIGGFLGGAQVGCDYQFWSHLMVGFQADISWASLKNSFINTSTFPGQGGFCCIPLTETFTASTTVDRFGTITGRLGYSFDRALFYMKGGAAWIHDRYVITDILTNATNNFGSLLGNASLTRWGWTVGAGLEYALIPNLSAFIEYDYLDFGRARVDFSCVGTTSDIGQPSCGNSSGSVNSTVPLDIRQQVHAIKVGLNWRFNFGKAPWGKEPVVAKY
jgi:outer membrane immunogenic protein